MSAFEWGKRTFLMGILNVTPDSFSGDGVLDLERAVALGVQQEEDGADILDVGGESTHPGSSPLSLEDELSRVIPVIEKLAKRVAIPLSVDTYKAEVAKQATAAGASIINDVWAGRMDPDMFKVAAETNSHIILMHNRSDPKNAQQREKIGGRYVGIEYENLLANIKEELRERIDAALAAGILREKIIVDPGIGFGKTTEQNLELVDRLGEMRELGYPVLVGPSRKSFVGYTLDLPPEERLEGSIAAVALCIQNGADIVRIHDVKPIQRAVKFTDAVVRGKW